MAIEGAFNENAYYRKKGIFLYFFWNKSNKILTCLLFEDLCNKIVKYLFKSAHEKVF